MSRTTEVQEHPPLCGYRIVVFFKKIHTETSRNEYKSRKIQLADAKKEETFTTHACPAQQCTAVMAPLGQKLAVNFKVDDVAFADKSVL